MALSLKTKHSDHNEFRWFTYTDAETEVEIGRIDNQRYSVALQRYRAVADARRQEVVAKARGENGIYSFDGDLVDVNDNEETENEVQCRLMSAHLIRDMRTQGRDDGKVLIDGSARQYTQELGEALLNADAEFFTWVLRRSLQMQREAYGISESAKKKRSPKSDGKSSGAPETDEPQSKSTQP